VNKNFISDSEYLIEKDLNRDEMFEGIDEMVHCDYKFPSNLPEAFKNALHKVVSTDPKDSIATAQRHLASSYPQFKLSSLKADAENRARADEKEMALSQLYNLASKRKLGGLTDAICWEASKYGMVAGQVMYLPLEEQSFDGDKRGLQLARHYGPFAVEVHNAKNVHVQYSSWGPEMVLLHKLMRTREVLQTFGKDADRVYRAFKKSENEWCTVFDLQEVGKRWVGVVLHADETIENSPQAAIPIYDGIDTKLDFLPWFVQISGTTSEIAPEHQIVPMLKSVYDSGAWKTQCILETLIMTKIIALHYAAQYGVETPSGEVPEVVGTLEQPIVMLPIGGKLTPINIQTLDTGMLSEADRLAARIDKSTVPRQIQTGEFPSGTPMGAVSIITETGMQTITPYRNTAARAMADIGWLMFALVKAHGKPLEVDAVGDGDTITIDPSEYDLKDLYIDVNLQPKQPIDLVARVNAAQGLIDMGISKERALELSNITDPQKAREEAWMETIRDTIIGKELENVATDYDVQIRRKMMTPELEAQAIMQEQAMQAQEAPPDQSRNPAMGGMSPVREGAPVREEVTGATQEGVPLR
jgi:hypothetical protein